MSLCIPFRRGEQTTRKFPERLVRIKAQLEKIYSLCNYVIFVIIGPPYLIKSKKLWTP